MYLTRNIAPLSFCRLLASNKDSCLGQDRTGQMLVKCVFAYVFFHIQGQLLFCTFKACIVKPRIALLPDDLL